MCFAPSFSLSLSEERVTAHLPIWVTAAQLFPPYRLTHLIGEEVLQQVQGVPLGSLESWVAPKLKWKTKNMTKPLDQPHVSVCSSYRRSWL